MTDFRLPSIYELFGVPSPDESLDPTAGLTEERLAELIETGSELLASRSEPSPRVIVCSERDRQAVKDQFQEDGWDCIPGVGDNPRSLTFTKGALKIECHFDVSRRLSGQALVLPKPLSMTEL